MKKLLSMMLFICVLLTACGTVPAKESDPVNFLTNMAETPEPVEERSEVIDPGKPAEESTIADESFESESAPEFTEAPAEVVVDPAEQFALEMTNLENLQHTRNETVSFNLMYCESCMIFPVELDAKLMIEYFCDMLEEEVNAINEDGSWHMVYGDDNEYVNATLDAAGLATINYYPEKNNPNAQYFYITADNNVLTKMYILVEDYATAPYDGNIDINGINLNSDIQDVIRYYGTPIDTYVGKKYNSDNYEVSYYWTPPMGGKIRADFDVMQDVASNYKLVMTGWYFDN